MPPTSVRQLTPKGQRTRERIVDAASGLMVTHGVAAVSLDDVGRATATSKSQMYHYFASKDDLVDAVVHHVGTDIVGFHRQLLAEVTDLEGLGRWAEAIVELQVSAPSFCGCPLGTLASELGGDPIHRRPEVEQAFAAWEQLLEERLRVMVDAGALSSDADPHALAVATLASLQGGLLMAKATQDPSYLRIPLAAALEHLSAFIPR